MLVLSRQPEQEIRLPGLDVTLRVLQIRGNNVRVGVKAPRDVRVIRGELADRSDDYEFDFEIRQQEADAECTEPGYLWPLGVSFRAQAVAMCA